MRCDKEDGEERNILIMLEMKFANVKCPTCPKTFMTRWIVDTKMKERPHDGKEQCDVCKQKYASCHSCGKFVVRDDVRNKIRKEFVMDEDGTICTECLSKYSQCSKCGYWHYKGYGAIIMPDKIEMCKKCAEESEYKQCYNCNRWFVGKDLDKDKHSPRCAECKTHRCERDAGRSSISWSPTYYADICDEAMNVRKKYKLSDAQMLMYNHMCRGDFYLRNDLGMRIYSLEYNEYEIDDENDNRKWVKKQLQPLIKAGLVKFESKHDCRDSHYTSWVFYSPKFKYEDLVNADCNVTTHNLALIKHYLKLPDGFDKRNKTYGDVKFLYKDGRYGFEYKGNPYPYNFNEDKFDGIVNEIWDKMDGDGYEYLGEIPGYRDFKRFKI